ncbi:MAG TPA: hypothetical protein VK696_04075 [Steroidobacteraceae bacterium]|jgi:hypothetical protein|nr:hypothetical protein [Steroidobacteraceae bacterium]
MPISFMRTLRLKVRRETYAWLNAAAMKVNELFNYCNRDVNAARNTRIGSRCRTSVRGNGSSSWLIVPSRIYRVREAGIESAWVAA